MTANALIRKPLWRANSLGRPLPDSVHAVSVSMPRWEDVVGYEEKRPEVVDKLACGYPRFFVHPLVRRLAERIGPDRRCLPYPSPSAAAMCADYIRHAADEPADILTNEYGCAVATGDPGRAALLEFWQHTGLIVSSRQAQAALENRRSVPDAAGVLADLRRQLAEFYECAESDVFLAPTGMAAQFAALRAVTARRTGAPTCQAGFPYVDTLKLQQKLGPGAHLLHNLSTMTDDLVELLERTPLAACFCEIPGNPLLGSADLSQFTPILRRHGVPLVVDDVVATPLNIDLGSHADLVATSLTKFIVGSGDAMGGAVICNPRSPFHAELRRHLIEGHEELLWPEDAAVLAEHARSFPDRMRRHNENGLCIAERLRDHPGIERVWYPKWEFTEAYNTVRRSTGGWSSLITFLPREAEKNSPELYGNLPFCKGPSLGTVFTLACPFTLLAHYGELDWAESRGVSRYLIRISVGLEEPETIWQGLEQAIPRPGGVNSASP